MSHQGKPLKAFDAVNIPVPAGFAEIASRFGSSFSLEIGSGTGQFACQWAIENPGKTMVAIERTQEKSQKFLDRFQKIGAPENLIPIRGQAIYWLGHLSSKEVIEEVFILYPNPYPKKSQSNKRFHNMPFMGKLKDLLKGEGLVHMATNESWLLEEAIDKMSLQWGFILKELRELSPEGEGRTAFEKKYLMRGEKCWQVSFEKN